MIQEKHIVASNNYITSQEIIEDLSRIKDQKIILNCICNYPVVTLAAEICFVLRVKGIFSFAPEEVEEVSSLASCLIISPNNVSADWFHGAYIAVKTVQRMKKPIILDLEKTNVSKFRMEITRQILEAGVTIIKGNYNEIIRLEGVINQLSTQHQPADLHRIYSFEEVVSSAQRLAKKYNLTIIVTGSTAFVTNGKGVISILHNPAILKYLPGVDNALTSLIAAFVVIDNNYMKAAAKAVSLLYIMTEKLERGEFKGPANFHMQLVDLFSMITEEMLPQEIKCYYISNAE